MRDKSIRRGPVSPKTFIVACGALMAAIVIMWLGWSLDASRGAALDAEARDLRNLALALSEDSDRALQRAERIQDTIIETMKSEGFASSDDLRRAMASRSTNAFLKSKIADVPYIDAITIIDAQGDLVNFSRAWPLPQINISDREYFKTCVENPNCHKFVSNVVRNRGSGTWNFYLGQRISGAGGELLGFVLMAMKVDDFEKTLASFAMPEGRVSLFHVDGRPLARFPHIEAEYEKSYAALPFFDPASKPQEAVEIRSIGDDTATRRLIGYSRSFHYPLVTTVSVGLDSVLAGWRRTAALQVAFAAIMFALIAITVHALMRAIDLSRRDVEAQKAIASHARQFETAINNIVIGMAMFDRDDRLIVSNARFAEIYSLPGDRVRPGALRSSLPGEPALGDDRAITRMPGVRELPDGRLISVTAHPLEDGGLVTTHEDVTERTRAEEKIAQLVYHDSLTGLPNRAWLVQRLERALASAGADRRIALHYVDLDRFKDVNDALGHGVGDELLRAVADRLRHCAGPLDVVARIGGDEFIVLQELAESAAASDFASRAIQSLSRPYVIEGARIEIGASIGIARAPEDGLDAAALSRKADVALYRAKAEGKGGFRYFEPSMDEEFLSRRELERDLHRALENNELELYYQPIVDASSHEIGAFEALLRWRHPTRGYISPLEFIPLAESSDLIVAIGGWVLRAACAEAARWPVNIVVSVNVSALQFKAGTLVDAVRTSLREAELPAHRLKIEITESIMLQATEKNSAILHTLNEMGVRIMLDDFGTGYSSLSYLRHFPFDTIKIDKSFVQNLDENSAIAILKAVSELAASLGMKTIAEGVETLTQAQLVVRLGCTELQGYLFGRPAPAEEARALAWSRVKRRLSA